MTEARQKGEVFKSVKRFNFFCGLLFPFVPDFSSFLSIKN